MHSGNAARERAAGPSPTVSVVIPCYNLGAYVNEAVQSVLDQTFPDFEILLIDDGSTDPVTRNLFASYRRPKTRVLRTENQGLARARNLGIREAAGRYVSCLDADDVYEPSFLERTVAVLEAEPAVAFASCWLTAFGDSSFLWNPATCDFPHLLAEDTVCSAALMRKEALLAVGGYDPGMPVAGYEDWDLAIGLVERGLTGRIVPEYLFRYRVRPGSMTGDCTAPANHAALMEYMVGKHAAAYRRHVGGVLEVIEKRTAEMEGYRREPPPPEDPEQARRIAFLEKTLSGVLHSTNWSITRPMRQAASRLRRRPEALNPGISVVLTCRDQGRDLAAAFESVSAQTSSEDEIMIVDDGSTDAITLQVLDGYRSAGFRVVRTESAGLAAARETGLQVCRAPVLFAMGADQTLEPGCLPRARQILDSDGSVGFVTLGARDADRTGFRWTPESADLPGILACSRHSFPVVRREAFHAAGGYDGGLSAVELADWDLAIRLGASGIAGTVLAEPPVNFHVRRRPAGSDGASLARRVPPIVEKHRAHFDRYFKEAILGQENGRRSLQAFAWDPYNLPSTSSAGAAIDWGGLRRLEPVSRVWGIDRGQPIDRYYIERFLERWRADVRGRVLEVKDSTYTRAYDSGVEQFDIVDIAPENPSATLIADLAAEGSLPAETFDCFVLTQTIHIIYDVRRVLENAFRALKPRGVLLATLPCVSRLDYESGLEGDFWRFTPASARRLFEEAFPGGHVEVQAFGNVLAGCGFLMGASASDLRPEELESADPYFPLLLCVRAVKAAEPSARPARRITPDGGKALILLYHRVAESARDRWRLCVSPRNFRAHLEMLARRFEPMSLSEMADLSRGGRLPRGAVAVTFDDGYRDNLTVALPELRERGIPATFFISGDGALAGGSFWWESLDASMERMGLDDSAARELHARLMKADVEERLRVMDGLPPPADDLPPRMSRTELVELSRDPLSEIGAHGWSHRALAGLPPEVLTWEVEGNVRTLVETTGLSVASFAYPFGGPQTEESRAVLREAGIPLACVIGEEAVTALSDSLSMPRLEVRNCGGDELADRLERVLNA